MTVDLNRHFTILQLTHQQITPLMLKNVYEGKPVEQRKELKKIVRQTPKAVQDTPTLLETADGHIANFTKMVEKKLRSPETLKQWNSTRKKIAAFLQFQYQAVDMLLSEVEYSFAPNFISTLP